MVGRMRLWLLPLFAFAALSSLSGQVVFSTLTGTMLDPSGSAIAGGQVAAHSRETGTTAAATTNTDGIYTLPNLRPGVYDVTFTAPSFSKTVTQGITLTVGEKRILNASMKIGQVNEQVEVAGAAPKIDLADATVQGVISESNIQELPLNARSWSDLADLEPGVFAIRTQPDLSIRDRANRGC